MARWFAAGLAARGVAPVVPGSRRAPARGRGSALVRWLVLGSAVGLVAGCSTGGSIFGRSSSAGPQAAVSVDSGVEPIQVPGGFDSRTLSVYFDLMLELMDDDPLTRAAAFNAAENAYRTAEITTNKLRYAIALSVPGHPGSDPVEAARLLRQILTITDILPEERMLVEIQLHQAERLEVLEANAAELRDLAAENAAEQNAESAATIRRLETEIANLRIELEDATNMLDALTSIEESISEREDQ